MAEQQNKISAEFVSWLMAVDKGKRNKQFVLAAAAYLVVERAITCQSCSFAPL